ncbi:MAG: ATP-binding protein [Alphaproteobacteria bacterium]
MDEDDPENDIAALRAERDSLIRQLAQAKKGAIFEEALENSSEAIVIYDADGRLVACNKSFRALYNYSEDEVKPGVHYAELGRIDIERGNVIIGDEYGDGGAYLERKREYRKTLEGSFIVHLKDGRWIKTNDRRMADGGFVSLQTDITEMKNNEAALFQAKIAAERASTAKSEFLANISHDLRTPLNAILGFSGMMINEVYGPIENENYATYTKHIHESGTFLLAIVNDILDTAKLENNRFTIEPEAFDPVEWTQRVVESLRPIAMENGIQLEVTDTSEFSGTIESDRKAINQILNNLVANACRHTNSGGSVTISWHNHDTDHAALRVRDTGSGMPQEMIEKIGQPFISNGSVLAPKTERGAGLGLYICSRLANLLGGRLDVESVEGKGTSVTVTMLSRLPA